MTKLYVYEFYHCTSISSINSKTFLYHFWLLNLRYFGQVYNDKLSNLLDKQISLHPLTASIQEFASAAKEANEESEVKRNCNGL